MAAGALNRRMQFACRAEVDDGYGNPVSGDWVVQFTVWGARKYLRGGEGVLAGRLTGRQPAILTVRKSSNTAQITTEWRATDEGTGEVFNIREMPKLSDKRSHYEMLIEGGVAV